MVRAIEQQAPNFAPGTRGMYQTSTYWFLCGEIVRRVSGLPLTRYWRREIAGDPGVELTLDVRDDELPLLSPTVVPDDDPFHGPLNDESLPMGQAWRVLKPRGGRIDQAAAWNSPATRRNGVSGFGNARGLAALAGIIVTGGRIGTRQVFSAAMVEAILRPEFAGREELLGVQARLGLAGFLDGGDFRLVNNPRAFFMVGLGGHIALGDPDRKVTFGFCVNRQEGRPFDQIPPVAAALATIRGMPLG